MTELSLEQLLDLSLEQVPPKTRAQLAEVSLVHVSKTRAQLAQVSVLNADSDDESALGLLAAQVQKTTLLACPVARISLQRFVQALALGVRKDWRSLLELLGEPLLRVPPVLSVLLESLGSLR